MSTPLAALRAQMQLHKIDAVLTPSSDFHGSEYTGAHFQARAFLSGFHGSAGTLLTLSDWAGLWTDGRYFLEAEQALSGSGITLMRQGLPDTPTPEAVLIERLPAGASLSFDGRCISLREGKRLKKLLGSKGILCRTERDLLSDIWPQRPPRSAQAAWLLEDVFTGLSRANKLRRLRDTLADLGADCFLLTALEEIAWLLNLRGGDIDCTPVLLAYLALSEQDCILFAESSTLSPTVRAHLEADGIALRPYDEIYHYAAEQRGEGTILLDGRRANLRLAEALPSTKKILDRPSPIESFKAIKNETEIAHIRLAHQKDGLALTRFLYWLSQQADLTKLDEFSLGAVLEDFRAQDPAYLGPSFAPIVAYGANGAIVHYNAKAQSSAQLRPEGFLLIDSGGQYLAGTTDCTRTLPLGALTDVQRSHYTAVLRGHLALAGATFLEGCTGSQLDPLARLPLWRMQLNYRHGTGHGVGYLLGVHEGPQQIHARASTNEVALAAGMLTSNEPGVYLEGEYGIRLENLLLCVPRGESSFGHFLGFEPLTLVPFARDAIDLTQLSAEELYQPNGYHQMVYAALSPLLSAEEAAWLSRQCAALP